MIARAVVIAIVATVLSGCATTRHASQPSMRGLADTSLFEVQRSGNMLTRYSYTRDVDKDEAPDLAPLFDHYDETYAVQQTASRYQHVAQWALPIAAAASVTMFGTAAITDENERELGIAAVTSAALGAVITGVAHLLGQHEYGKLGDLYNERLREEAAGN